MLTVVTGPPCAGKTTYVSERKRPGDIVIDFDDLADALGAPERWTCTPASHVWHVAAAARTAAIAAAIARHRCGAAAWIIDARPAPRRLGQYMSAGAAFVRLTADPAELHARATAEGRPAGAHDRIDEWFRGPVRW